MTRALPFFCGCFLVSVLALGCGGRAVEDGEVRARNLKTGQLETFGSAEDVPDGFIVCSDEECSIPAEVPCQGLGALTCQMHEGCMVKVLSCQGEDLPLPEPLPAGAPGQASGEGASDAGPGGAGSELCEVTCVPAGPEACESIEDQASCEASAGCGWGELYCSGCACPEGVPCDCPAEETCVSGCMTLQPLGCESLQTAAACLSNPTCAWDELLCPDCLCSSDDPTCACDCQPSCTAKARPDCQVLGSEQECLANSACEWGQFICPPCYFDDSGAMPPACDCGLSCRAKELICPPHPTLPAIGCADGSPLEPVFDELGCVMDYRCGTQPLACGGVAGILCPEGFECLVKDIYPDALGECVPAECEQVTCKMYCEHGFARDDRGCEICQCAVPPAAACVRTGCSGQLCAAEHLISTCEWADYYACYDLASCDLTADGSCGWIPTPQFDACMSGFGQ